MIVRIGNFLPGGVWTLHTFIIVESELPAEPNPDGQHAIRLGRFPSPITEVQS